MRKLAAEFGLSDVGLAKICRKNGIPHPGIGYWRLVETGHAPKRTPLLEIHPEEREEIAITAREPKPFEPPKKADLGSVAKIEVRNNREITHPLAVRTKRVFEPTSKADSGAMVPKVVKAPHVRASAPALPRILRILDLLFCAVEQQGYLVVWEPSADAKLKILIRRANWFRHYRDFLPEAACSNTGGNRASQEESLRVCPQLGLPSNR
jgi:hypothetical protein